MAIIIGRDKKSQQRVERADVLRGIKDKRVAAAERKAEQKAVAEAEEAEREAARAAKAMENAKPVRGRKAKSVEPANE